MTDLTWHQSVEPTEQQRAEIVRVKASFPYRIAYGALNLQTGQFIRISRPDLAHTQQALARRLAGVDSIAMNQSERRIRIDQALANDLAKAREMAARTEPLPERFYIDPNGEVQRKPGRNTTADNRPARRIPLT